jgi:hypothetical protein
MARGAGSGGKRPAGGGGGPRPLVAKSIRCYGAKGSFTLPAAARDE